MSAQTLLQGAELLSVLLIKIAVCKAMMRALTSCLVTATNDTNIVKVHLSMVGCALRLCLLPHLHQPACPPAAAEAPWL